MTKGSNAAEEAANHDVNFTFKEKKVTPAQPEAKAAAPSKAQAQAAPAASKAKAAPVQLKTKVPVMPKVDKNLLSARSDRAGAQGMRLRSLSPPHRSSSSGSEASFVAMETSFPPLSLPAEKKPRGLLPGKRPAVSSDEWLAQEKAKDAKAGITNSPPAKIGILPGGYRYRLPT